MEMEVYTLQLTRQQLINIMGAAMYRSEQIDNFMVQDKDNDKLFVLWHQEKERLTSLIDACRECSINGYNKIFK